MRREVLKRLVDHEVYVARFYLKSDHPKAAALRLEGRDQALPGLGPRAGAAVLAGRDLPAHVRSAAREGDVRARRRRVRQRAAGAALGALPRVHRAALRRRTALQDAADRDAGPPPRRPPSHAPMADGEKAGLRELVARGRAHYETASTPRRRPASPRCCARRRPTPTSTTCWASSITRRGAWRRRRQMFKRGAAHQPGLHRGGAEPGRDLQRPRQVRRGQGRSTSRRWRRRKRAPRELDPFAKGKIANMHADIGRRLPRRRRCTRRRCASTSRRWRSARRSSTSAPSSATPAARWATSTGAIRELERVRAESPRFVGGPPEAGPRLLRGRRGARTPPPSGAPCWRPSPRTASAKMYLALLDPAAEPDKK